MDDNQDRDKRSPYIWQRSYWFGVIDSRPLALYRILLALMLLKNAFYNLFLAQIFYSDDGVVPRSALFDGVVRYHRFSLMDALGPPWMAFAFFIIWIVVLLALLVGYRTRLMTILNFLIVLSIHERNGLILTGADTAMRVFSFWIMFIPVGQHYGLDAVRNRIPNMPEPKTFALPARMLQLQLIIIYMVTGYLKLLEPIWTQGEALHYVAQLDSMLLLPGFLLRKLPAGILQAGTYFTLGAEMTIPFLLLFPLRRRFVSAAFVLAVLLHGGIAVLMAIPDFSYVMITAFVPHFDPDWINKLLAPLQRLQPGLWRWSLIRMIWYRLLAFTPFYGMAIPLPNWKKYTLSIVLIPLMCLVIWWNLETISAYRVEYGRTPLPQIPAALRQAVQYPGLWQSWDLFAPLPIQYDGFLVIPGHFEDDEAFDLRTGQPLPAPTRELFARWGPFMRFEKFEENIYRDQDPVVLGAWGRYYCRLYNEEQNREEGRRLATLEIQYVIRQFSPPGEERKDSETLTLWYHWCYDEYAPADN